MIITKWPSVGFRPFLVVENNLKTPLKWRIACHKQLFRLQRSRHFPDSESPASPDSQSVFTFDIQTGINTHSLSVLTAFIILKACFHHPAVSFHLCSQSQDWCYYLIKGGGVCSSGGNERETRREAVGGVDGFLWLAGSRWDTGRIYPSPPAYQWGL